MIVILLPLMYTDNVFMKTTHKPNKSKTKRVLALGILVAVCGLLLKKDQYKKQD